MDKRNRYSIDLPERVQERLADVAKHYKLTQGEIVEALLANMAQVPDLHEHLAARRQQKVAGRTAAKLARKIEALPPEQKAALLAGAQ